MATNDEMRTQANRNREKNVNETKETITVTPTSWKKTHPCSIMSPNEEGGGSRGRHRAGEGCDEEGLVEGNTTEEMEKGSS